MSCGLFDTLVITHEDRIRGELYQAEFSRKKHQATYSDIEEYLKSLTMKLEIKRSDDFSIPRIAQLTQKTNQFNLTTRRYSEDEIRKFAQDRNFDIIYATLGDKFGDMGIIGVCILKYQDPDVVFDSFLLSCRALGRKVEAAFLREVLLIAIKRGASGAIGEYIPTKKNQQTAGFFPDNGFTLLPGNKMDSGKKFRLDLKIGLKPEIFPFEKIISKI